MTQSDRPISRRCDPSDLRLSFHHTNLWTDPWLKGSFMASAQLWLPTSYESQFSHDILNIRVGGSYLTRLFKDKLELSYGLAIQKYFQTRKVRGFTNDDGTPSGAGGLSLNNARVSSGTDGSIGSGGPMNDNWLFINSFHVGYYFLPQWTLNVDFLIYNYIRYSTPGNFSNPNLPSTGRHDNTWGIIELSYQPLDYLSVALGISSLQPALTNDNNS